MSKATIVSICPFETEERKPGLMRGYFKIPAAKEGDFVVVEINDTFSDLRLPATNIHHKIPEPALQLAQSIVNDFCTSHIASAPNAQPGMFVLPGLVTKAQVKTEHADKLKAAEESQIRWFMALVKLADDDWNRYHLQSMISDLQRLAAQRLGIKDREWLVDYHPNAELKDCPACFEKIHTKAIRCPKCSAILDKEKAKAYGLTA